MIHTYVILITMLTLESVAHGSTYTFTRRPNEIIGTLIRQLDASRARSKIECLDECASELTCEGAVYVKSTPLVCRLLRDVQFTSAEPSSETCVYTNDVRMSRNILLFRFVYDHFLIYLYPKRQFYFLNNAKRFCVCIYLILNNIYQIQK